MSSCNVWHGPFALKIFGLPAFAALVAIVTPSCTAPVLRQPADQPIAATQPATVAAPQPFTQRIPGTELRFNMVPIPGGTFTMGSPDGEAKRRPDEGPRFEVEIEPFYMGKYEVTWDLYNEFANQYMHLVQRRNLPGIERIADAVSYPTPIYDLEVGPMLKRMGGQGAGYPAVSMSQFAAKQFTKWLSAKTGRFYRLPTEAEWEYAARAGTTTAYFFGDDARQIDDYAWHYDNSAMPDGEVGYHRVGMKKPNPFGLYDIYGNVAEIVLDQYEPTHYAAFMGRRWTAHEVIRWPSAEYPKVVRGGGYESEPQDCRSAARQRITVRVNSLDTDIPKSPWWWTVGFDIGFRIVSPVKAPPKEEQEKYWEIESDKLRETLSRDSEIRQLVDELRPVP